MHGRVSTRQLWINSGSDVGSVGKGSSGGDARDVAGAHSRCVALRNLIRQRCWRRRSWNRVLMRRGTGCGLNLRWARLLLEDGIVAQTLALALLAVSADRMAFVTLDSPLATSQTSCFCATLDFLLVPATRHHTRLLMIWGELEAHWHTRIVRRRCNAHRLARGRRVMGMRVVLGDLIDRRRQWGAHGRLAWRYLRLLLSLSVRHADGRETDDGWKRYV